MIGQRCASDINTTPIRILITGASGFAGQHLIPVLTAAFPGTDLLTPVFDLSKPEEITAVIRDTSPDSCIHLAAISTPALVRQDEDRAWRVNLHGTLHLAHAILDQAPNCQLVFASSADAYGDSFRSGMKLDETAPLAPLNPYTATKAAADLALGSLAPQGLRVVRLRPFNHTGPGQPPGLVVAAFAKQVASIAAGRTAPTLRVGNLAPNRDFLDVRDVCAAYAACVARRNDLPPGVIINLASGVPRRVGDVLTDLMRLAGVAADVTVNPALIRAADMPVVLGDASRARELLNWTPVTPWQQTLRDVMDDWRHRIATEPETD